MAKETTVPSRQAVKDLQLAVKPTGKIGKCVQAGTLVGTLNGLEGKALLQELADVLDYCQKSQEAIFELQAKLALQTQQTLTFNA